MSLRIRLIIGMALVGLTLVVSATVITTSTERNLTAQVDEQLRAVSLRQPRGGAGGGTFGPGGPSTGQVEASEISSIYFAVLDRRGDLRVLRSPNLRSEDIPLPTFGSEDLNGALGASPTIRTVGSTDSSVRYRVSVSRSPSGFGFVVGLPLADVDAAVARLIRVELAVTALVLALLGLVAFWVLRLGLRPISSMTSTATAIAAGDMSQRVPLVAPGTEAAKLGAALNTMLSKIEDSFNQRDETEARLRQFAADASHELRTPVTTIRGYAELYRRGGLSDEHQMSEAMTRTEQEAIRMGALIGDLLMLARLDQGKPQDLSPIDLASIVRDATADARAVEPQREISIVPAEEASVLAEENGLRQVVANLLSNALIHSAPNSPVWVAVFVEGESVVLEIRDTGTGMDASTLDRVFERFYRADPSRSRASGGSGLGLPISRSIVETFGGNLLLKSIVGEGTTARVELPRLQGGSGS